MNLERPQLFGCGPSVYFPCFGARVALQRCPILRAGGFTVAKLISGDNVYTKFLTPLTRSLVILTEVFPQALDLHHLVFFDYLSIHSGDVQGPPSLHIPLPLRPGELTVRQQLIERGLFLMMSRELVERLVSAEGFQYAATDNTNAFLTMLNSRYIFMLKERASWVAENFGQASLEELRALERRFFQQTTVQFQTFERREDNNL